MAPVVGAQSIADIRCRVAALDALVGVAMVAPAGCAVAGGNTVPGAVGDAVHAVHSLDDGIAVPDTVAWCWLLMCWLCSGRSADIPIAE